MQGRTAFQSQVVIHNNHTNGVMCSSSRQASGGMAVCKEKVKGEIS